MLEPTWKLGVNTLYIKDISSFNSTYDGCMEVFENEGLYVLVNLPDSDYAIVDSYTPDIYAHYLEKLNVFSQYNNTLGIIVGSNVHSDYQIYVKAAIRDMRSGLKGRKVPLGYSHSDMLSKKASQVMMGCGEKADFFGLDISSNCKYSTHKEVSIIIKHLQRFEGPTFFTGFGCRRDDVRLFEEASLILSDSMGGIFREYSNESGLGLVEVQGDMATPLSEFFNAQTHLLQTPKYVDLTPNINPTLYTCPKFYDKLPPTPNQDLCTCAQQTLECQASPKAQLRYKLNQTLAIMEALCREGHCHNVKANPLKGQFPEFYACDFNTQLSLVFNNAYQSGYPCHFDGFASRIDLPTISELCKPDAQVIAQATTSSHAISLAPNLIWFLITLKLLN
ncbi:hypothetical protein L0F63_000917 [Massospora cicadina]|nr:hypothetical protein L0F63_000917 [Massospora cicadina]